MKKAVAYIRVSTVEQAEGGVSLADQEHRIRAYAQLAGLELVELIAEEGVSGTVPLSNRPAGSRLLEAMKRHKASHVIALKLDRLFRDAADALTITRQWDQTGVALHLVDVGGQTINTAAAMGRMFLTMMAGFAELERNLISERTASALQHKKRRREVYAHTPLGFDRTDAGKLEPNPDEQALIKRIMIARSEGKSMGAIATRLNAEGLKGKNGGRFYASSIRHILSNSIYQAA